MKLPADMHLGSVWVVVGASWRHAAHWKPRAVVERMRLFAHGCPGCRPRWIPLPATGPDTPVSTTSDAVSGTARNRRLTRR